jgi:predicted  nucleic acid-binding Zn-ribbon protein
VARVIEQSKSSAEALIESIQDSLREQRQEVEDSVVATDLEQLQQQVSGLEQQVREGLHGAMQLSFTRS